MNEPFHPSKLVAGAVGGAGWRPWGLSNLIMAIFSDTRFVTSGLSFCEFLSGKAGRQTQEKLIFKNEPEGK